MSQSIKVVVRSIYGKPTIYPGCPAAEQFAAIAGTKTLSPAVIRHIKALGYVVTCDAEASARAVFA